MFDPDEVRHRDSSRPSVKIVGNVFLPLTPVSPVNEGDTLGGTDVSRDKSRNLEMVRRGVESWSRAGREDGSCEGVKNR